MMRCHLLLLSEEGTVAVSSDVVGCPSARARLARRDVRIWPEITTGVAVRQEYPEASLLARWPAGLSLTSERACALCDSGSVR